MLTRPETRYARSGEASIAYQVLGEGPVDLVFIEGPGNHLELEWENPAAARALEQLASFARLIRLDRRGTGLSDPVERPPTLEQQMDDLCAVMEAVGVERTALFGGTDAGLGAMFAGTYPDRVSALILWGVAARAADFVTPELAQEFVDAVEHHGEGRFLAIYAPSRVGDRAFEAWWRRFERAVASPGIARKLLELNLRTDISAILPTIRVPTLVLHRSGDTLVPVELGRDLAGRIPGARFLELPGIDNYCWTEGIERVIDPIQEFLTGSRGDREPDRVLSTVLFTDIVASTEHATRLGDSRWLALRENHDDVVRRQLAHWRGREVKTVGDGFLATFDGPARALRCAQSIVEAVKPLGLQVRAGIHTGEVDRLGDDVAGISVHIAARVLALAHADEVLASSTVRDLVVGSGLRFAERGTHRLKGVPGDWRVLALAPGAE